MSLLKKLALFAGAVLMAGNIYAMPKHSDVVCPLIEVVKSEGISLSEQLFGHYFVTYHLSQYNTNAYWVFLLGPVAADSADDSIDNANGILSGMEDEATPMSEGDVTYCRYNANDNLIQAIAVQAGQMISPTKLGNVLKQVRK